jgi:hypothetical protein
MTRLHASLVGFAASSVFALAACSSEEAAQGSQSPEVIASTDLGHTILAGGTETLQAGTYTLDLDALTVGAEGLPKISMTVPDGWSNIEGWGVETGSKSENRWMGITFWDVAEVYAHPCQGSKTIDPGPTVADLAEGLAKQPLRHATEPVNVAIDGIKGLQLQWSVPAGFDFSTCPDGHFNSWTSASGSWNGGRYQQGPGQVDRLWILDINGKRLVVDAMYMPSANAADRQELWQVVESIGFET